MSNGTRANRTGNDLEKFIDGWLNDLGYTEVSPKNFFNLCGLDQSVYACQCYVGHSIYNKRRRVDFILYHPDKWKDCLIIQAKWQASSGSVEEKYPYEVLSIQISSYPTIIVLDGGGYSAGAEKWLKDQAGKHNLIKVLNQGEFARYASRGNL